MLKSPKLTQCYSFASVSQQRKICKIEKSIFLAKFLRGRESQTVGIEYSNVKKRVKGGEAIGFIGNPLKKV